MSYVIFAKKAWPGALVGPCLLSGSITCVGAVGYNEFDFFLENEEYRLFDGCKIEI
jgi:hypothetical protein